MSRCAALSAFVVCLMLSFTATAQVQPIIPTPPPAVQQSAPPPQAPPPAPVAPPTFLQSDPHSGYFSVYVDMMRNLTGVGTDGPTGAAINWGSFENRYIAAGTQIGLWGAGHGTTLPMMLFFGGGAQFHIPIGPVLIIPAINLGLVLTNSTAGTGENIGVNLSLAVGYKWHRFFWGLEAQRPIYLPIQGESTAFFPPLTTMAIITGLYY